MLLGISDGLFAHTLIERGPPSKYGTRLKTAPKFEDVQVIGFSSGPSLVETGEPQKLQRAEFYLNKSQSLDV